MDNSSDISHLPLSVQRYLTYTQYVPSVRAASLGQEPPSTSEAQTHPRLAQEAFAQHIRQDLVALGVPDVRLTAGGIVMGSIPATPGCERAPALGIIARTCSGTLSEEPAHWRLMRYKGGDVVIDAEHEVVLSPSRYAELLSYTGQDLIVPEGESDLGVGDKAAVAILLSAIEVICRNRAIPHAKLCFAFMPGNALDAFDLQAFGARYAFMLEAGPLGQLQSETFNAAIAQVTFVGENVHPSVAKGRMVNAAMLLNDFLRSLPRDETPERTEGYQGYYHLIEMKGTVEKATAIMLIREYDRDAFEVRKSRLAARVSDFNAKNKMRASIRIKDQYFNMGETLRRQPWVLELARESMHRVGVTPLERPVRGGTDGAHLTQRGLPCPSLFTGGLHFDNRYDVLPMTSFLKAVDVVTEVMSESGGVRAY